ncbi:hypothetical protein BDW72DRAFT_170689 [Aspergillus terricola var. indicus]
MTSTQGARRIKVSKSSRREEGADGEDGRFQDAGSTVVQRSRRMDRMEIEVVKYQGQKKGR